MGDIWGYLLHVQLGADAYGPGEAIVKRGRMRRGRLLGIACASALVVPSLGAAFSDEVAARPDEAAVVLALALELGVLVLLRSLRLPPIRRWARAGPENAFV